MWRVLFECPPADCHRVNAPARGASTGVEIDPLDLLYDVFDLMSDQLGKVVEPGELNVSHKPVVLPEHPGYRARADDVRNHCDINGQPGFGRNAHQLLTECGERSAMDSTSGR